MISDHHDDDDHDDAGDSNRIGLLLMAVAVVALTIYCCFEALGAFRTF